MNWYRAKTPPLTRILFLALLVLSFSFSHADLPLLPETGRDISGLISVKQPPPPTVDSWFAGGQLPSLYTFSNNLVNGDPQAVRGVYIPGFMALPIVQQPYGNTGFVSQQPGTVTQFQLPNRYGVIGLLAHNYLSGQEFYRLVEGLKVVLVNGDGSLNNYRITEVVQFQKVTPGSNWSHYINLETGERLTTYDVFSQFYQGEHHLTFQTCLERDGLETWGLRFVVAEPLES